MAREEFDIECTELTSEPPRLTITSWAWRTCARFLSGIRPSRHRIYQWATTRNKFSYLFVFSNFLIPTWYPKCAYNIWSRDQQTDKQMVWFITDGPAAVYESRPTDAYKNRPTAVYETRPTAVYENRPTDGRQAGANHQMFFTIEARRPFVTPDRFFCLFFKL